MSGGRVGELQLIIMALGLSLDLPQIILCKVPRDMDRFKVWEPVT
jgi:hypothetical protein